MGDTDRLLLDVILLPAMAAPVALVLGRAWPPSRRWFASLVLLLNLAQALMLARNVEGKATVLFLNREPFFGLAFTPTLRLDSLGAFMLSIVSLLSLLAVLSLRAPRPNREGSEATLPLLLLASAALNGVIASGDLLTLYFLWVLVSLFFALLLLAEGGAHAGERGVKLFLALEVPGVAMLAAMVYVGHQLGTFDIAALTSALRPDRLGPWVLLTLLLAMGTRAALAPLHSWFPGAAAQVPWPVGALMAGAMTQTALYIFLRFAGQAVFLSPEWQRALVGWGAISLLVGAGAALWQEDMRSRLAFLGVSQAGYVLVAFGAGQARDVVVAVLLMVNGMLFLPLMFLALEAANGAAARNGGWSQVARASPLALAGLVIGMAAAAGLPPLNGFMPRLLLFERLATMAGDFQFAAVLLAAFLGTAATVVVLLRVAARPPVFLEEEKVSSPASAVSVAILLAGCLLLGLLPQVAFRIVEGPVGSVPWSWAVSAPPSEPLWARLSSLALMFLAFALGILLHIFHLKATTDDNFQRSPWARFYRGWFIPAADRWRAWSEGGWTDLYNLVKAVLLATASAAATVLGPFLARLAK